MTELEKVYEKTLKDSIFYTINQDLDKEVSKKLLENLEEIGYSTRHTELSEITEETREKNKYVYIQIDVAIHLREKNKDKYEELYLPDENGHHYLTDEGTNSIVIGEKYQVVASWLGLDNPEPKELKSKFNNAVVQAYKKFAENSLVYEKGDNLIVIKESKSFFKPSETQNFEKYKQELIGMVDKNIQHLMVKVMEYSLKQLQENVHFNLLRTEFKPSILNTDNIALENVLYGVKQTGNSYQQFELETFGQTMLLPKPDFFNKLDSTTKQELMNEIKIRQEKYERKNNPIEYENNTQNVRLYFELPKIEKSVELQGEKEKTIVLNGAVLEYCKSGLFLKNKQDAPKHKELFKLTQVNNKGVFSILANPNNQNTIIKLDLSDKGIVITELGNVIKQELTKRNISTEIGYYKNKDKGYSLDSLIKLLNGLAPKIYWDGLLGFMDGRTTLQSAVKKAEEAIKEDPNTATLRKKYGLPKHVNIRPDDKVVGNFHGIPELEGTTEKMILMWGLNSSNPQYLSKEEILQNSHNYKEYGFKE